MLVNSASGAGFAMRSAGTVARVSLVKVETPVRADATVLPEVEAALGGCWLALLAVRVDSVSRNASGIGTQ